MLIHPLDIASTGNELYFSVNGHDLTTLVDALKSIKPLAKFCLLIASML